MGPIIPSSHPASWLALSSFSRLSTTRVYFHTLPFRTVEISEKSKDQYKSESGLPGGNLSFSKLLTATIQNSIWQHNTAATRSTHWHGINLRRPISDLEVVTLPARIDQLPEEILPGQTVRCSPVSRPVDLILQYPRDPITIFTRCIIVPGLHLSVWPHCIRMVRATESSAAIYICTMIFARVIT